MFIMIYLNSNIKYKYDVKYYKIYIN
jgi:hypothetical protein